MEGMRFVRGDSAIMGLILLGFASSLLVQPVTFFMPVFADDVLHVGATGLGLLLTARGFGAFAGAMSVASFGSVRQKGRILFAAVIVHSVTLFLFAQSGWLPTSLALMAVAGAVSTIVMTMSQSLLQLATPDEMMGRVMSSRMVSMGFMSLGSLWIGAMAELAGAPLAVALGAVAYGVFALALFGLNPSLRRSEEWDSTVIGEPVANPATPE
jgi:predicted MFS family arabinose efflux permease